MEMTFPHNSGTHGPVKGRSEYRALLAAAIARQANSRTVHIVRRAQLGLMVARNDGDNRIQYFAGQRAVKMAVCGAFWRNLDKQQVPESSERDYHWA